MSVNLRNTDGSLTRLAGLVNDAEIQEQIAGIEAVIPSGATADNKLVTNSDTEMAVVQTNSATWIKITFDEAWKYPLLLGVYSSHWGAGVVVSIEQRNVVELSSGSGTHITSPAYYHGSAAPYYYYIQVRSHGTIPLFVTNVSRTPGITIEALSETPDVSDLVSVPVKQLVTALTTSDLTSTVSSGSTAPITSGGVASALPIMRTGQTTLGSDVAAGGNVSVTIKFDTAMPNEKYIAQLRFSTDANAPHITYIIKVQYAGQFVVNIANRGSGTLPSNLTIFYSVIGMP